MTWRERCLFFRFSPALNFSDTNDISKNPSCGQNLKGQWQVGQKREVLFQDILGCAMWRPRNASWLFQILLTGVGGAGDPFLPLHSTWWFQKLSACQAANLPRQWTNTAWSGIFLFLRSLSETYGQFFKVPFSQILLKDPKGCYAKISSVKLKVVCNGASYRITSFE